MSVSQAIYSNYHLKPLSAVVVINNNPNLTPQTNDAKTATTSTSQICQICLSKSMANSNSDLKISKSLVNIKNEMNLNECRSESSYNNQDFQCFSYDVKLMRKNEGRNNKQHELLKLDNLKCLSNEVRTRGTNKQRVNNNAQVVSLKQNENGTSSQNNYLKTSLNNVSCKMPQEITYKSPWDILCKLINCKVAFKKQYNGKKYNWIQLAGHPGRFKPGEREGYILKLMEDVERECLKKLQIDVLAPFVPKIDRILCDKDDGNYYTEMQDLLYSFQNPSIMDIKIGTRTFIVDDSNDKETKPRHDLYLKLIEMAPDEPTPNEHELKAINKRRYMSWRESSTCSSTLGFRIEAIKKNHVSEKEFYNVREKREVMSHFRNYTDNNKMIMKLYAERLIQLENSLKNSKFFYSHEMIGSSLLFVHDNTNADIWMIDFGKTRPLPPDVQISHDLKWQEGNLEDGYLIGIKSLIEIFQESIHS